MIYGYCRVSTKHQNLQRQVDALIKYGVNPRFIFTDKYTGQTLNREGLNELISVLKSGDVLVIKEIDRLGRNRKETKDLIVSLIKQDIELVCLDMPYLKEFIIDKIKENEGFIEIMANALLDVILEVAEQERKKIIGRTSEGRKRAIEEGRKFGRTQKVNLEVFRKYYEKFLKRELKAVEIQKELGISKQCYYNYVLLLKGEVNGA
ncbi:recombinase family protein [Candidatus Cetobacterium colombiensis]|jgi:DNA invertase Pin-like site-specific DNA recombinase|uniref:Recombinase family protein n=1 Tax=Candidatus Cetobacterium colombiensis TaxID=3073100 RepID=A0ABU4WE52_9FUSO|nr:recombinase family protein [Candidatus Cetobacterium colombiensis]MDX8337267.1 recombinase family protein [Candidatus Cetobacterium colombiensis]